MITFLLFLLQSETTVGKLTFTPPKDWKVTKAETGVMIAPPGESHLMVMVPEGEAAKGELKEYQERMWKQISAGAKKVTEGQSIPGKTESGWESLMSERTIDLENGQAYAIVIAYRAGDRFECACIAADNQATVTKYQAELAAFVKSLRYPASFRFYTGFYSGLQFVGGQGQKFTTAPRYLALSDDGYFSTGYSDTGYDRFDFKAEAQKNPSFGGTYTIENNIVTLKYGQGSVRKFEKVSEKYDLKNPEAQEGYWEEPRVEDLKLDGVFRPANGGAPVTFKPDGTFVDEGGIGFLGFGLTDAMKKPGRGKYRTANFSLIVNYDDGRERRIYLVIGKENAGEKNPKKITLGGFVHERQ